MSETEKNVGLRPCIVQKAYVCENILILLKLYLSNLIYKLVFVNSQNYKCSY